MSRSSSSSERYNQQLRHSPHTYSLPDEGLTGNALLWYERYVAQGYRTSEARSKALRHKPDEYPSQRRFRKTRPLLNVSTYERSEGSQLISSTTRPIRRSRALHKVGILPEGYPHVILDHDQLLQLELAIVKEVAKGAAQKIMFDGRHHRPGMLVIYCANTYAEDWLLHAVPRLSEWQGKPLLAVCGRDIPPRQTVSMLLPHSQHMDLKTLLRLIDMQNDLLNPSQWIVVDRRDKGKGQLLTVGVDDESRATIERQNYSLRFGLGHVQVNGLRSRVSHRFKSRSSLSMESLRA